jgi:hypothetical protein
MRRLFVLLPFALVLACGSSDSGGDGSTAGTDGGADGSTTSTPDGGKTPTPDGSTPAPDASVGGPFCPTLNPAPKLCEDFEDGTLPNGSQPQTSGGGACAIDAASLKCDLPTGTTSVQNALVGIPVSFDAAAKKLVASFAFQPAAAAPANGTLVIARLFVGHAHSVSIEPTSENGPVIREQENMPNGLDVPSGNLSAMPAAGAWTRYELTVDIAGKTATLKANGAQVATLALTGTQYDLFALNLGLQSDSPFSARYDDVVVDVVK